MSGAAGLRVVVVDAGGANLGSVCYALERLGVQPQVVADAAGLQAADRVILPGVGAAPEAMRRLHAQGMVEPLRTLQSRDAPARCGHRRPAIWQGLCTQGWPD